MNYPKYTSDPVNSEGLITLRITDYEQLKRRNRKLSALEAGGVDNWEGYDYAIREFYADEDDE